MGGVVKAEGLGEGLAARAFDDHASLEISCHHLLIPGAEHNRALLLIMWQSRHFRVRSSSRGAWTAGFVRRLRQHRERRRLADTRRVLVAL